MMTMPSPAERSSTASLCSPAFARRAAPGEPLLFTAKLHHVKHRTVVWSETFDAAKIDALTVARRVAEGRAFPRALLAEQP